MRIEDLRIKIFADGADLSGIQKLAENSHIRGFTTNPTLMAKAGISDYKNFSLNVIDIIGNKPVSFEVFADDFAEMERQALEISSWGSNVYVKVPVSNTKGEFSGPLINKLSKAGVKLNITALMTVDQVIAVAGQLDANIPSIISVFAGRIADTGIDPLPMMSAAVDLLRDKPEVELIWASPRELLNVFQANEIGCHIITATTEILNKLAIVGKDLDQYSLETVQMFHKDALNAGFQI